MTFTLSKMRDLKTAELVKIRSLLAGSPKRSRDIKVPPFRNPARGTSIIAEIKKGSPTMGLIRQVTPSKQALTYVRAGADAVSVLCDGHYFQGDWKDLKDVALKVDVPVLCKEFILFPEQIDLAFNYGADAVLLISNFLSPGKLKELYTYTQEKGITPLVEIHSFSESEKVLCLEPDYIMVNMRNLQTLEIDKVTAQKALQEIPEHITRSSASAINDSGDIREIRQKTGTAIFLVGTALMKSNDPEGLIREMCHVH